MKELYTALCEDIDDVLTEHLTEYALMDEDDRNEICDDIAQVFNIYMKNIKSGANYDKD